jgi:hypothetical protein
VSPEPTLSHCRNLEGHPHFAGVRHNYAEDAHAGRAADGAIQKEGQRLVVMGRRMIHRKAGGETLHAALAAYGKWVEGKYLDADRRVTPWGRTQGRQVAFLTAVLPNTPLSTLDTRGVDNLLEVLRLRPAGKAGTAVSLGWNAKRDQGTRNVIKQFPTQKGANGDPEFRTLFDGLVRGNWLTFVSMGEGLMEELTHRMMAWAAEVVAPLPVTLAPPQDGADGLSVYLLDVRPAPAPRTARPPLRVEVRYLLTPPVVPPEAPPAELDRLVFALLTQNEFEPEPTAPPVELWVAFGLTPRPAVLVRGMATRERVVPDRPVVREPLAVDLRPAGPVSPPPPREG